MKRHPVRGKVFLNCRRFQGKRLKIYFPGIAFYFSQVCGFDRVSIHQSEMP